MINMGYKVNQNELRVARTHFNICVMVAVTILPLTTHCHNFKKSVIHNFRVSIKIGGSAQKNSQKEIALLIFFSLLFLFLLYFFFFTNMPPPLPFLSSIPGIKTSHIKPIQRKGTCSCFSLPMNQYQIILIHGI